MHSIARLYLSTLRDTLTGETYQDGCLPRKSLRFLANLFGATISRHTTPFERHQGRVWPATAMTMIGTTRLNHLWSLLESLHHDQIAGDFVECGVWRGGASIFATAVLYCLSCHRNVILCDSFGGLPKPLHPIDKAEPMRFWKHADALSVSLEQVKDNFRRFHLLHDNVQFVPGWFKDTLVPSRFPPIALLRADGDMYESTKQILCLYEKVSPGGYVVIDDYYDVKGCRQAVDEFLPTIGHPRMIQIDCASVYWRKPL